MVRWGEAVVEAAIGIELGAVEDDAIDASIRFDPDAEVTIGRPRVDAVVGTTGAFTIVAPPTPVGAWLWCWWGSVCEWLWPPCAC